MGGWKNLLYLIPVVNIWWFTHWKSPYDYFEQNYLMGGLGCLVITPVTVGGIIAWWLGYGF